MEWDFLPSPDIGAAEVMEIDPVDTPLVSTSRESSPVEMVIAASPTADPLAMECSPFEAPPAWVGSSEEIPPAGLPQTERDLRPIIMCVAFMELSDPHELH
jgi:hypothetical protein